MASQQSSAKSSGTEHQVGLVFAIKEQLDLVYKQLNHFRNACKSVDRLNRAFRDCKKSFNGQPSSRRLFTEFMTFDRNYRVWRKKLRKLDRQMLNVDLYDKIYDLYESLVIGGVCESMPVDDNSGISKTGYSVDNDIEVHADSQSGDVLVPKVHIEVPMDTVSTVGNSSCFLQPSSSQPMSTTSSTSNLSIEDHSNSSQPSTTKFMCNLEGCRYSSIRLGDLKKHMATHSDRRPFKCDRCGKAFKIKGHLTQHRRIVHSGKRVDCQFEGCTASCTNWEYMNRHVRLFHSENPPLLNCDFEGCDYSTDISDELKTHRTVHANDRRTFRCSFEGCRYTTFYSQSLKHHQNIHSGERPFKCTWPGCGYSSHRHQCVRAHKVIHTRERVQCRWEGCDYSSYRAENLRVHESTHTDARPFRCDQCDKSFRTASHFSLHKRTHDSEPRFKCQFEGCQYSTHYPRCFKVHQVVHTDGRPYKCLQCDRAFRSASHLTFHKRTHDSEPRFKCNIEGCDYITHHSEYLRLHLRIHSDERPYKCTECDKSFKISSHLWKHTRRSHKIVPVANKRRPSKTN